MLAIAIAFSGIAMPKLEVEAGVTDITNPERLMLGDAWTLGDITESGTAHFYSVNITKAGWLTVDYQGWSIGDSYYEVLHGDTVYKYSSNSIWGSSDINPKSSSTVLALEPGSYVIKVCGRDRNIGKYRVKASFKAAGNNESSNNNDFATAQKLYLNKAVNGFLSRDDRVDFFRIDLTKRERIRLILTTYFSTSRITVYDKDFRQILSKYIYYGSEGNPNVYEYEETLDPGPYYIKIFPEYNECGRFSIQYKQKIMVKTLSIKANKSKVVAGQKVKLSAKISPSNASSKVMKWTSGDTGIAAVDENTGMVTTYRPGVVRITASALDGSGISKVYTLIVRPKKMATPYLSSPKSKQLKISYGSQYGAKAYEVQYSTNSKFKGAKLKRTSKTGFTVKSLKKKKVYYVRVRAYVQRGSTRYPGSWSKVKKIKIK